MHLQMMELKKFANNFKIPITDGGDWMKLKFNKKAKKEKFNPICE